MTVTSRRVSSTLTLLFLAPLSHKVESAGDTHLGDSRVLSFLCLRKIDDGGRGDYGDCMADTSLSPLLETAQHRDIYHQAPWQGDSAKTAEKGNFGLEGVSFARTDHRRHSAVLLFIILAKARLVMVHKVQQAGADLDELRMRNRLAQPQLADRLSPRDRCRGGYGFRLS